MTYRTQDVGGEEVIAPRSGRITHQIATVNHAAAGARLAEARGAP